MMGTHSKVSLGISACLAVVGVGLIVAAFATDQWINSHPEGKNTTSNDKLGGQINFGLFSGDGMLNFGFGDRYTNLILKCDTTESACAYVDKAKSDMELDLLISSYKNQTLGDSLEAHGLFSLSLYASTLFMLILAMVWGWVAIAFSVYNIFGRPIETISGPSGLLLWNLLALLFTLAGLGVYVGMFYSELDKNILSSQTQESGLTSDGLTEFDYSFYLVVAAAGAFLINMVELSISGKNFCSYRRQGEKEVNNDIILY